MYWICYIYGALSYLYELSSRSVYQLLPAQEIVKYYNIYHTFDIEEAAERMMENIGYKKEDNTVYGLKVMKKLFLRDKLMELKDKNIEVYVDIPIGMEVDDVVYRVNFGQVKQFVSADDEYQKAYVLGIDEPVKTFVGKMVGFVSRFNDIKDILIVSNENYLIKEINKFVNFQEKRFKHKIVLFDKNKNENQSR